MIEGPVDFFLQDAVEIGQVHDHRGLRIDLALDGDLERVVVAIAMRSFVAVDGPILLFGPIRPPEMPPRVEMDGARQQDHGEKTSGYFEVTGDR